MTYSSCLNDANSSLALDSSVLINLLSTERAGDILAALTAHIVVAEEVVAEIERGEALGRHVGTPIAELVRDGAIHVVALSDDSLEVFALLVTGGASDTLGDGEAATIALAVSGECIAVIDEKKAHRLCTLRHPSLRLATTVDILAHPRVSTQLGASLLAKAVQRTLIDARMQVREGQFDWVVELIGREGAEQCPTLRRLVRGRNWGAR